jgi:mRNA interferase RelE/StbE
MPTRIELHEGARADLRRLDHSMQARVRRALFDLQALDNPRDRLLPYAENLKGFWKLRVGDYRLVCEMRRDAAGELVLVVHIVHRSKAYLSPSVRTVKDRANDN